MKARRRFARVSAPVAALVVTLFLLISTYAIIASQVPPAGSDVDDPVTSSSATASNSQWITETTIAAGDCQTLTHNLAGDPDDYAVEMWFLDTDDGWGRNRLYYGGVEVNGNWRGAYWQNLEANTIRVCRLTDDDAADQIRIRIWIPDADPDYASPWMDIGQGETLTFTHDLGITNTLTVGLWFSDTERGIHHYGYGGLSNDAFHRALGAHWHNLTDSTVQVTRHPHDRYIQQVRVMVVISDRPDYDSLENDEMGGWKSIGPGATVTFTHGLNWDPDMLLARAECFAPLLGTHQFLAGGNHDWLIGWQGTNLQNLTDNTVQVYRQANDQICPQVRVRIWRRGAHMVYLPLVLNNDAP